MLPGKGFYLDQDLKALGITRPEKLPHVFERSNVQRLVEALKDERAAITTYAQIVSQRAAGFRQTAFFPQRDALSNFAASWCQMFNYSVATPTYDGTFNTYPGGSALDNTNVGSLGYKSISNPVGGNKKYIISVGTQMGSTVATDGWGTAILVDLLVAASSIPLDTTSLTNVNTTALPRYTSGAGVMVTFTCGQTALSSVDSLMTIGYTNQAGAGSRSNAVGRLFGSTTAAMRSGLLYPMTVAGADATPNLPPFCTLQKGDYGVQSLDTLTMGASGTAASKIQVMLYYPLVWLVGHAQNNNFFDWDLYNMAAPLVEWTSTGGGNLGCLNFIVEQNTNNNTGFMIGAIDTVEG